MSDPFRQILPFRVGDRVRTLRGHVGQVQAIHSNTLTILLDAGGTHTVSAIERLT